MNASLPDSWPLVRLGVCLRRRKDTVMPSTLDEPIVGLVGLEDIQDGGRGGITNRPTKPSDIDSLKTRFQVGDILYGKLRPYLNKVGIAQSDGLCSTEIWAFTTEPFLDARFAAHYLASSFFVDRVESLTKGANLPRLDSESFDSISIPLPPLSEQQRIVDILQEAEEIRRLRVQAEAKTAELIPALFQRVFLSEPNGFDRFEKKTLGQVLSAIETGWSPVASDEAASDEKWGVLKLGAVTWGTYQDSENKALLSDCQPRPELEVKAGDLLLVRKNTRELVGASTYVSQTREKLMFSDLIFRLSLREDSGVSAKYLWALLSHPSFRPYVTALADGAAPNIPKSRLVKLRIPVPSEELQQAFVAQLEAAVAINPIFDRATAISKHLQNSLSAHAFTGRLTEVWRAARPKLLAKEARKRDNELDLAAGKEIMVNFSLADPDEEREIFDPPRGFNHEQLQVWLTIKVMTLKKSLPRYFTAEHLAEHIKGPLHRHPHAIEPHLIVFAVRGIVIPVSRARDAVPGKPFAASYRLPMNEEGAAPEQRDDVKAERMKHQRTRAAGKR